MRASCLAIAATLLLVGCGRVGSSVPAPPYIGAASHFAEPAANATFYVDGVHGNDKNDCRSQQSPCKTIQRAVHISVSGDTINVAAAVYPENVLVRHTVQIKGAGLDKTIVDGEKHGSEFLIAFNAAADVSISGMTLRNGTGSGDGGAIYHCNGKLVLDAVDIEANNVRGPNLNGYGGAIYNCPGSILTIINSTIRNNSAKVGGAICNGGQLTIFNSTFNDNTSFELRGGGAIFNYGTLHIANSTFSGNTAAGGFGGAIHDGELVGLTGGAQIDNSTISGNTAFIGGGGGIHNKPGLPVYVQNTVIAKNHPNNCGGFPLATEGFNLSDDRSCDLDGAGDLNGVDPKLGPLENNGGPTSTMALLGGSPAIEGGNRSGCRDWLGRLLATDQRGMPRPDPHEPRGCDIGAYESQ